MDGFQPGGVINVIGEKTFREVFAPLIAKFKVSGVVSALRRACKNIEMSPSK
jgi:hypothetical protein